MTKYQITADFLPVPLTGSYRDMLKLAGALAEGGGVVTLQKLPSPEKKDAPLLERMKAVK